MEEMRFTVSADARIELLTIVQLLSDYPFLSNRETGYGERIQAYFAHFVRHPAVEATRRLTAADFDYDAPVSLVLHLSPVPELVPIAKWSPDITSRVEEEAILERYVDDLRDFARVSNFSGFFAEHGEYYGKLMTPYLAALDGTEPDRELEAYTGVRQSGYHLIVSPLCNGGYGPRIKQEDGSFDAYTVMESCIPEDANPVDYRLMMREFLWHEFGHSVINPLCDMNAGILNTLCYRYETEKMGSIGYSNHWTINIEYLVRAMCNRMTSLWESPQAARDIMECDVALGFRGIDRIITEFAEYDQGNREVGNIVEFFPRLVQRLIAMADKPV
jgi:hypothetical protein